MQKKAAILRYLNMRAVRAGFYSAVCRLPALRTYLNYYQEAESLESAAEPGSIKTLRIWPARDYGLAYTQAEREEILQEKRFELDELAITFKMARVRDVTILGSSGVTVSSRGGKVLSVGATGHRVPRNWVIARPLRPVRGEQAATYLNLLGVRIGHRHFAHFFSDMLVPLFVYLTHWHDPDERVVCLVREDLSRLQRDVFGFIAADFPSISFEVLPKTQKLHCNSNIYIAYQNRESDKDNMLARDYLWKIRDFLVEHYGIGIPDRPRRIYVSRGDTRLRRVVNESVVLDLLANYGFEAHEMGKLPFPRQIELFRSAEAIVAPHGAGLANLMFCRPGAKVLEIFPENFITDWFTGFAKILGLDYGYLIAGRGGPINMAYRIDLAALEDKLKSMGIGPRAR